MLKVFLIEDAPRILSRLIETFQSTGTIEIVGFAESEQDALLQLRTIRWDVAIVDIALRDGSGLSVLHALKNDDNHYGVRLVLTNHASLALKTRALALGADALFDKSREMDDLVHCVQTMAV